MKKVMIVDDEFIVRVGIRSIIDWEENGYTVAAEAKSGEDALEKIASCHPDIVLTDLVMDNMDGLELIRVCAKRYPDIRFVVLSSYTDFEHVRSAMKLGARDYIFKPAINPEELLRLLNEICTREQEERSENFHNKVLDGVIRENLPLIKYNLLQKCKHHAPLNQEEFLSQFQALDLHVDLLKPYVLLYMSIDNFARQRASGELKDLPLIKLSMENIIYELMGKKTGLEVFNHDGGDMVIFVNAESGPGDFFYDENFRDWFLKIREYYKRYLGLEVSGTISPVINGAVELPEVLNVCETTMRLRTGITWLWPYNGGVRNEIARAKEYVFEHMGEKIGVQGTAAHVGMSENYFSHLFKKETGIGFIDYVNHIRMEKAAELLENSDLKVADVAERIGINNPNYFSVLFKKLLGASPQEYRENCKKS
jgi:two-component system response regulator YesN